MKIVYLDCIAGISGDMTLAALVDAGADRTYIEQELSKLALEPYEIAWKRVNKNGISALKADVLPAQAPSHAHRHFADIARMIREAGLPEHAMNRSLAIFGKIAAAEAKIHGMPIERVHFHEVGAVDSIVDAVGVALALESLDAERVYVSAVPLGYGTVACAHGIYPVPAPATLEMMKGWPIASVQIAKELTTPTGAGIVSGLASGCLPALPAMAIEAVGYGAGTRDLRERPNVLRAVAGVADEEALLCAIPEAERVHRVHAHEGHQHEHDHHHHHEHRHHDHGHSHHDHDQHDHAHEDARRTDN